MSEGNHTLKHHAFPHLLHFLASLTSLLGNQDVVQHLGGDFTGLASAAKQKSRTQSNTRVTDPANRILDAPQRAAYRVTRCTPP